MEWTLCGHAGNPEKSKTGGGVIVDDAGLLVVDINVLKLIATPKGKKTDGHNVDVIKGNLKIAQCQCCRILYFCLSACSAARF